MNARGRDALVKAALDGVPQAFGTYDDGAGRCGLGVLGAAIGVSLMGPGVMAGERAVCQAFDLQRGSVSCPECGGPLRWHGEDGLIAHLNDHHRLDFAAIANKMPVTDPEA